MRLVGRSFTFLMSLILVVAMCASPFAYVKGANAEEAIQEQAAGTSGSLGDASGDTESQSESLVSDDLSDSSADVATSIDEQGQPTSQDEKSDDSIEADALSAKKGASLRAIQPVEEQRQILVTFMNGSDVVDEQMVIIKDGVITSDLQIPMTPNCDENQKFTGWYDESGNELISPSADLEQFLAAVGSDDEITYTADYEDIYYAFFMSSDDEDAYLVHTATTDQADGEVTLYTDYHPNNARVVAWKNKETNETYDPGQDVAISKDTVFVPEIRDCYWVTFVTQCTTSVDSQFVEQGSSCDLTALPAIKKRGYRLAGWSTTPNGDPVGGSFTPQNDTILYAIWKPAKVEYTVVFWTENADDEMYSIAAIEVRYAYTGTVPNLDARTGALPNSVQDKKCFTFERSVTEVVESDGSTVVHVYYKRNSYTLTFRWRVGYFAIKTHTVTAKYDSDISYAWDQDPIKSLRDKGSVFTSSATGKDYSFLQKMPNRNITLTEKKMGGRYTYKWSYWLEVLNGTPPEGKETKVHAGKTYYKYQEISVKNSNTSFILTYDEDYFPLSGFYQKYDKVPDFNRVANNYYMYAADLYYDRSSYSLVYENYGEQNKEAVLYEDSLAGKGGAPTRPAGMSDDAEFMGWYLVPPAQISESVQPYVFDDKTMPAHDVVLYAYWKDNPVEVHIEAQLNPQHYEEVFKVPHGSVVADSQEYKDAMQAIEGSDKVFVKWADAFTGTTYDINEPVNGPVSIYAVFAGDQFELAYDIEENGGSGIGPLDTNKYAFGIQAKVKKFKGTPPKGMDFKSWLGSDGKEYYPGEEVSVTKGFTLTALYAPKTSKIDFTYYANFPNSGSGGSQVVNVFDGQNIVVSDDVFSVPEGYSFIGWNTKADGSGESYTSGSKANITKDGSNALYAQYAINQYSYTVQYTFDGKPGTDKYSAIDKSADYGTAILQDSGASTNQSVTYMGKSYVLEGITNENIAVSIDPSKNVVTIHYVSPGTTSNTIAYKNPVEQLVETGDKAPLKVFGVAMVFSALVAVTIRATRKACFSKDRLSQIKR